MIGAVTRCAFAINALLLGLRRWKLPAGSITFLFGLSALTLTAMRYNPEYGPFLALAQLLAGALADLLLHRLGDGPGAIRILSFSIPTTLSALYFIALARTGGILRSVDLWVNAVVMSGLVRLVLSYLAIPPGSKTVARA